VTEHADEALPGEQFLFAERAAEVGDDDEVVRAAAFAKLAAAHAPAAGAAGEGVAAGRAGSPARQSARSRSAACAAEDALGGLVAMSCAGAVDEAERFAGVEGEDGDVDLLHHGAEERGGLEGAEALVLEHAAEHVDFPQDVAEGLIAAGAAGAHGEIALAEGGEEVGHGLQRADDVPTQGEGKAKPGEEHHQPKSPLHLGFVIVRPEHPEGADNRWQASEQGVVEHALFVGGAAVFGRSHQSRNFLTTDFTN
jgi:hypothetical protein